MSCLGCGEHTDVSSQIKTGPRQCAVEVDGKNLCGLAVLETREGRTSHLLKDSVGPQEMVIRSAMRNCQVEVDFVVIGAGGSFSNKGGGGSGSENALGGTLRLTRTVNRRWPRRRLWALAFGRGCRLEAPRGLQPKPAPRVG